MNTAALRTLVIYGTILPLAAFIGWMISDDLTMGSFSILASIGFLLLLPALLKWHYVVLVFSLQSAVTIFFLPGKPTLWMIMGGISFGIAILHRIMQKRQAFISAPSITFSLLFILAVVLITGKLRGGFASMAFGGSSYGGKGYYYIIGAIVAYFGLVSQPIPMEKARQYMALYFLPVVVFGLGSMLIYMAGPSFYILYTLFPVGFASFQAGTEASGGVVRFAGFWPAAAAIANYLMAVHGIRGVLTKWWRVLVLFGFITLGTLAGFRSFLLMFLVVFAILFVLEGLLRSPLFPALVLVGLVGILSLSPFASSLPKAMQRTISFLPVEIDPMVRRDAESSLGWRLDMWKLVVPDLPKYVWLGKGYSVNPTDMYLAQQAALRGRTASYEPSIVTGDFHNGPLSVYVPFGSIGILALLIFLGSALRAAAMNYRHGHENLRTVNRFIFAFLLTKVAFFVLAFGSFYSDMPQLVGPLGLSIALNGGICRRPVQAPRPVVFRGSYRLKPA